MLLIFAFWLKRQLQTIANLADEQNASSSDYTVYVTKIPKDLTEPDLVQHFNYLFGRGGSHINPDETQSMMPVGDLTHDPGEASIYEGSYIAEVAIAKRIGITLRAFMSVQKKTTILRRARAQVQSHAVSLLLSYNLFSPLVYTPLATFLLLSPGAITLSVPSLLL